jgi:PAS domain S-box-containing protein
MAYRCRVDNKFSADYLSDGFFELTGYSQSDIIHGEPITLKSIIHPDDFEYFKYAIQKSFTNNGIYETRYRILTANGEERWVWNQGKVIKDENGNPQAIEGVISNITELVKTENALKEIEKQKQQSTMEALNEKEMLLKEIHHRVKNNLQIIASILKLKDMQSDNEEIHELLLDCRSRVFSMAMIHEKLYKSENLAGINIKDYISTLQMHLVDEYGAEERKINIVSDCDDSISLDIDTAIPCGLIINEILTNSLKYAFDESGGEINIDFHKFESDKYRLIIKDNGKGFPKSYDYKNSESLGMQLIYNLTTQLEGTIEVRNNPGAEYIITIPKGMQKSVKF